MSLLPFIAMTAVIFGIIAHVFVGAVADRRAYQLRRDDQLSTNQFPL